MEIIREDEEKVGMERDLPYSSNFIGSHFVRITIKKIKGKIREVR